MMRARGLLDNLRTTKHQSPVLLLCFTITIGVAIIDIIHGINYHVDATALFIMWDGILNKPFILQLVAPSSMYVYYFLELCHPVTL